ncbi:uncharacterized protein [Lepeophtheirus salmonis]|uniref:uncharacterized protein isoform X2 n=1 Tax=Lepeophtheirus salmonis TaxID=72036 RepID=UPI001AE6218F|nr:ski-like protein isoform X2 [Lepeophtheirus salmonis]
MSVGRMTEEKADRVKELLECYMDSAGRSLTGPSGGCGYSLPPDVELSLERECMGPSVWSVGGKRRRSVREKKTPAPESGLYSSSVTLSKMEEWSCIKSKNSRSGRHLSGEMIRRILERQKAVEKGEDVKGLRVEGAVGLKGHPVLLSRDPGTAEYKETFLWGERIACFNVGGEQRCCLPQILNSILDSISLQAIHAVCDDLRIYCPTCTPDQLELLKSFKVIPLTASQCGLITKSDAERIFSVLLDRQPPRFLLPSSVTLYLKVVHDCFGRNYGLLIPQLYTHQFANCVQCIDCGGAFNPQRFVCHVHSYSSEKRTVHWGFDSSHWRTYLRLCESSYTQGSREKEEGERCLTEVKSRFQNKRSSSETNEYLHSIQDSGGKKPRVIDPVTDPSIINSSSTRSHPQFQAYNNIYNLYNSWAAIVSKSKIGYSNWGAKPFGSAPLSSTTLLGLQGGFPFSSLHARLFEAKSDDNLKSLPENTTKFRGDGDKKSISDSKSTSFSHLPLSEGKKEEECNDILNKNLNMSLADDINAIRDALEGASAVAKDRTLKTLERITARLAQTEIERDIAIANYNELQKQNCCTQEELFKKRAELRELLAQDTSPHSNKNRPSVTLELLRSSSTSSSDNITPCLPKIDLKTPAILIEEKETKFSESPPNSMPPYPKNKNDIKEFVQQSQSLCDKMKDSDDLRDRMVFMEAELRALRNELKIRMLNESSKGDEKRITPDQSLHFANSSTVMSNKKQFKSE